MIIREISQPRIINIFFNIVDAFLNYEDFRLKINNIYKNETSHFRVRDLLYNFTNVFLNYMDFRLKVNNIYK